MAGPFIGVYLEPVSISLGAAEWGWHGNIGLHVLKLFCTHVFDRSPALKNIIGYKFPSCWSDATTRVPAGVVWGPRERPLCQVWAENIWITTSGAWSLAPIKCVLENTKVERIIYSVDYPLKFNEKGGE